MRLEQVIVETVSAVFSAPPVRSQLVLKGGTALRLAEGVDLRLSTDIDLSAPSPIAEPEAFFSEIEQALSRRFAGHGLDVFDLTWSKRPKKSSRARGRSDWGGWNVQFKLSTADDAGLPIETRRRRALVPVGAASSKVEIQISENEYCAEVELILVAGTEVPVYSHALLILEKLRAICQQHSGYPYSLHKNRARDYFDIYQLVRIHRREPTFFSNLARHLSPVFAAKDVPLSLLTDGKLFEPTFSQGQALGFPSVEDTVKGDVQAFSFYEEQLKALVGRILDAKATTSE